MSNIYTFMVLCPCLHFNPCQNRTLHLCCIKQISSDVNRDRESGHTHPTPGSKNSDGKTSAMQVKGTDPKIQAYRQLQT